MAESHNLKKSDLFDMIWQKPISVLAPQLGMSANGLAKVCDRLNIPRPPKGYWRSEAVSREVTKPDAISEPDAIVQIGGDARHERKRRARYSPEERRRIMLDVARQIASSEGVHEVSLRRIALQLEMSEAQAHNVFSTREDLLVELAVEEVEVYEAARLLAVERGGSRVAKVVMSSLSRLRLASQQGAVLQSLMRNSKVRQRVNERRRPVRQAASERHVSALLREKQVDQEEALASVSMLTALVIRAGDLVSEAKLTLNEAERFCIPVVIAAALERERA
ncbi:MAG: TetR family transcriptional regulator [Alphaproteobacteria bacterium]|nr:TetR family transcriptional regulator [Alphaproteobacteria bacterium]